jgi:cytochrome c oxidase cbb3-type subunit III
MANAGTEQRAAWIVVAVTLLTAGCDFPGRPERAHRPVPADKVMDFRTLYGQNCAGCHGANGKMGPAPPLNDPIFRAIVSEGDLTMIITSGRLMDDIVPGDDIATIAAKGRNKTLMPAFAKTNGGTLTPEQIEVLVKEIKGVSYKRPGEDDVIQPEWGSPGLPPSNVPSYTMPATDSGADPKRGAEVFARACASCHGDDGKGTKLIHDRTFLALLSDQALRRLVITGRPDLGMPNYAERHNEPNFKALTEAEVTHLVELLASWRREK